MRTGLRSRRLLTALSLAGLALTAACGNGTDESSAAAPEASASASGKSDMKVGLAYDVGGRGDKSFNDSAVAGLDKAKAELGFESLELSPNASGSDRGDNLRQLAEDGFDPIIAVGFSYADSVKAVSADFPDSTFFIIDDSSVQAPNVKSLVFAEEQGSFLVGAAAALKSTSGSVGFVGGVETPLLQKFEAGFVAGAKQVKPDVKTTVRYLSQPPDFSGFGSPDKGRETANGMYDAGVDVVYAAAGGSGVGVFQAALAKKKLAIGVDSDQYESVGDPTLQPVIISSMLKRVDNAVYQSLQKVAKGEDVPAVTTFDLKTDGVGYSTSGGKIDDIAPQLEDLKKKIIDGTIKVPTTP